MNLTLSHHRRAYRQHAATTLIDTENRQEFNEM